MIPVQNDRNLADRGRRRRAAAVAGHRHDADTARAFLQDEDGSVRASALSALLLELPMAVLLVVAALLVLRRRMR